MGMTAAGVAVPLIASALSNNSSGGYNGSYLPPGLAGAAGNEMNLIPQLSQNNLYQQYLPDAQSLASQGLSSPYYGQAMQGSQLASHAGMQQGANSVGAANQLYGQMGQIPGLQQQLIGSAFDPQSQLYQYLQSQNTNQTNAQLAAMGLGTSGAGAQVANQSNQLFNQNWQNNLLQRQLQGVQGVGALNQSAGQLGTVGTNIGTQGTNLFNQSAAMPYQTQLNSIHSGMGLIGTAGQYGQQSNIPYQQQIADYNSYQGLGSPASQFNQSQAMAQGAAAIAQPIGNAIGNAFSNYGGGGNSYPSGYNSGSYFSGGGGGYNPYSTSLPGG